MGFELDKDDLYEGTKFIVGTWQVDYIVNAFSNDLAHIPAKEWKSEDGRDFSDLTYTFTEDHAIVMKDLGSGKEEHGTWEQTSYGEYHYTLNAFLDLPDSNFLKAAETLSVQDGCIVFSIGFLAIGMKKIAEGTVSEPEKEPDIGDLVPTDDDLKHTDIVGKYEIVKTLGPTADGGFGLITKDEMLTELKKRVAAGEMEEEEIPSEMKLFDMQMWFTEDHKVKTVAKIPDGVSQKEIEAAVAAGHIGELLEGGYYADKGRDWKYVNGSYYYDTGEERELMGKKLSSWDPLVIDADGCIDLHMMVLKKMK